MSDKQTQKIGKGKPGPGRPKGLQNKLTRTVKEAVEAAFNELQADAKVNLAAWGKENPSEFYRLAGKLIPAAIDAKVSGTVNVTATPTDERL